MRAIVTGAAGFIGSSMCDKLIEKGYDVIGIDVLKDNYSLEQKKDNIRHLVNSDKFTYVQEDLISFNLEAVLQDGDVVFHMAALPGVRKSWGKNFSEYADNNLIVTQRLLEQAKEFRIKKFVYASSSSIYGDQEQLPIHEDASKCPVSPYGITKLAAENLCHAYAKSFGLPAVGLRYFTVYGPRQRPDMAFHIFMRSIIDDKPLRIFGDGLQKRDFTYVDDIVEATINSADIPGTWEYMNVGSHRAVTLNYVIEILKELFADRHVAVDNIDTQMGDVRHTFSDIKKAMSLIRYKPSISLEDGIRNQYLWFMDNNKG